MTVSSVFAGRSAGLFGLCWSECWSLRSLLVGVLVSSVFAGRSAGLFGLCWSECWDELGRYTGIGT